LNAITHRNLSLQFENRQIQKNYIGIVHGYFTHREQSISLPLRVNGDRRHRTVVDHLNGKDATTNIVVKKIFESFTFLDIYPLSGYTHQIRCHLAATGHPLLGDSLYTPKAKEIDAQEIFPRLALHAHQIHFVHPSKGTRITLTAPIPEIFQSFVSKK
jgi:23S rRNA-/tRNA-specific pseudouridylate synthase